MTDTPTAAPEPSDASPGPTDEPDEIDEADDLDDEAPELGDVERPRRRWVLIGAALVVVLAAAGGVVAWRVLTPDPRDAATDYFARLAAGDAAGALRLVDRTTVADGPLLTDAALRDPGARPTAMTVTQVRKAGDTATLTVQYRAGATTVIQTLQARRHGRAYTLTAPLVRLTFAGPAAAAKARIGVNGVPVDASAPVVAFPGAYAVTVDATTLFDARSVAALAGPDGAVTVVLPPGTLSSGGRSKLDAALTAALDRCTHDHFGPLPACPSVDLSNVNDPQPSGAPLTWMPTTEDLGNLGAAHIVGRFDMTTTITRPPSCTWTVDGEAAKFGCADGTVHLSSVITMSDGKRIDGPTGDSPLTAKGTANADEAGNVTVTFT